MPDVVISDTSCLIALNKKQNENVVLHSIIRHALERTKNVVCLRHSKEQRLAGSG